MSREIKFAYLYQLHCNVSGQTPPEWVKVIYTLEEIEQGNHNHLQFDFAGYYTLKHKFQFTGLKDKNGVEIHDGDIVSIERKEGVFIAVCTWSNQGSCFYFLNGKHYRDIISCAMFSDGDIYQLTGVQVIGNIHQNPELL